MVRNNIRLSLRAQCSAKQRTLGCVILRGECLRKIEKFDNPSGLMVKKGSGGRLRKEEKRRGLFTEKIGSPSLSLSLSFWPLLVQ